MSGGLWALTGTRGARDGIHADVAHEQSLAGGRQQGQLDAGGETTRVGHVARLADCLAVQLGQSVDVVVVAFQPEILRQVDNPDMFRDGVFLQELFALSMTEAEKHNIHVVERHRRRECHITLAKQSPVHVADEVAGITFAVDELQLGLGVVDEQADEFAGCVASPAEDSNLNHSMFGCT